MKSTTLPQSRVQFIENRAEGLHAYMLDLEELTGVTTVLKQVLFYDKYNGISEEVLRRAAIRGTAIHEAVQAHLLGIPYVPAPDTLEFKAEAARALASWQNYERGSELQTMVETECVEYLVSNEQDIASKVDVVFKNKGGEGYTLADIKTTSEFDEEYLSWQLSIYADFFRQQTGEAVTMLVAMWYNRSRGTWQVIQVKDKGHDAVQSLIDDWRKGLQREVAKVETQYPAPVIELGQMYRDIENEIKRLTAERDEFRKGLMGLMKENGIKSVELEGFRATYIEPTERRSFDVKKLLALHPELEAEINECYKTSQVSESIKITI